MATDFCDREVFEHGTQIAVIASLRSQIIDSLVQSISKRIGVKIDWFWVGGKAAVFAVGDIDKARDAFRPYAQREDDFCIVEDDGTWTK